MVQGPEPEVVRVDLEQEPEVVRVDLAQGLKDHSPELVALEPDHKAHLPEVVLLLEQMDSFQDNLRDAILKIIYIPKARHSMMGVPTLARVWTLVVDTTLARTSVYSGTFPPPAT